MSWGLKFKLAPSLINPHAMKGVKLFLARYQNKVCDQFHAPAERAAVTIL
jgi:hypothetical protein